MALRHRSGSGKGGQFAARQAPQMPEGAGPEKTKRRSGRRAAGAGCGPAPLDPLDKEAIQSTRDRIRRLNRQAGGLGGAGALACIPMLLALPGVYDGIPEGWQGMMLATSGATSLVLFWAAAGRRHIAAIDLRKTLDGTSRRLGMPPSVSMDQSTIVGWLLDDHPDEGAEAPPELAAEMIPHKTHPDSDGPPELEAHQPAEHDQTEPGTGAHQTAEEIPA